VSRPVQGGSFEATVAELDAAGRAVPWRARERALLWRGGTQAWNVDRTQPRKAILRALEGPEFGGYLRVRCARAASCASDAVADHI
jgi:hypothetical protein